MKAFVALALVLSTVSCTAAPNKPDHQRTARGGPLAAGRAAQAVILGFHPPGSINVHDLLSQIFSVRITNAGHVPVRFLPWVGILLYDSHGKLLNDFASYDTRDKLPLIMKRNLIALSPGASACYHRSLEGVDSHVAPGRYILMARLQSVSPDRSWAPELGSRSIRRKFHIWDKTVDSPPAPVLLYSPTNTRKSGWTTQRSRPRSHR